MNDPKPPTTAVIQPLPGIGDMIWLLPALQALAADAPDGKLVLFAKKSSLADKVLADEPWFTGFVALPKARGLLAIVPNFLKTWWALMQNRPDRIFILHQSLRYRLAAYCAGIRSIHAYPRDLAKSKINGWEKSLQFLDRLNIPVTNRHSHLHVSADRITAAQKQFGVYPQPWFILSPGASEANRCWPEDRFATCADTIIDKRGGTVFLSGAEREKDRIDAVHKLCRNGAQVVPIAGLAFDQFIALTANATGILGNDSGPINVAAALGIPAFVLCGRTLPGCHSPKLILITPEGGVSSDGMQHIGAEQVRDLILAHYNSNKSQKEK